MKYYIFNWDEKRYYQVDPDSKVVLNDYEYLGSTKAGQLFINRQDPEDVRLLDVLRRKGCRKVVLRRLKVFQTAEIEGIPMEKEHIVMRTER